MDEIEDLLREEPQASGYYALTEMHYGRLGWLAEHIRRCNFQISPAVARKILSMLENSEPECFFELKAVRRAGLAPRAQQPRLQLFRDFDMAVEVARKGGFRRGQLMRVCFEVGKPYGLSDKYVAKRIRQYRSRAIDSVDEEAAAEAYRRDKVDI